MPVYSWSCVLPVQPLESSHMHCGLTQILSNNCLKEDRGKASRFVESCSWGSRGSEGSVSSTVSSSFGLVETYARAFKELWA